MQDKRPSPLARSPPSTNKHEPSDSEQQTSKDLCTKSAESVQFLLSSLTTIDSRLYIHDIFYLEKLRDAVVMLLIVTISQLLILSGDIETNPGPVASDKPLMNELILLKNTDGSDLRIIKWVVSLSRSECEDFAHLLLDDQVKVDTHRKLSSTDEFVREVLRDWLSSGDRSRAVPRTWAALADCMEDAGLPGDLVKAIRDTCPSGSVSKKLHSPDPPSDFSEPAAACTSMEKAEVDMPPSKKMKSDDGFIIENGPIHVFVEPDIPERLLSLMKKYADMLVVLEEAKLNKNNLRKLRSFLSSYCSDAAFRDCTSSKKVVEMLKVKLKIYIFNIDTLLACLRYFGSKNVSQTVQQYKEQLDGFFSDTYVKNLQNALRTKIISSDNMERITLKLNETVSNDTLENLKKLVHHIFGNHSKALILHEVRPGCVCVTYIVPSLLIPTLTAKIAGFLRREDLTSSGVLNFMIEGASILASITYSRRLVGSQLLAFLTSCAGSRRPIVVNAEVAKPPPDGGALTEREYTGVYAIEVEATVTIQNTSSGNDEPDHPQDADRVCEHMYVADAQDEPQSMQEDMCMNVAFKMTGSHIMHVRARDQYTEQQVEQVQALQITGRHIPSVEFDTYRYEVLLTETYDSSRHQTADKVEEQVESLTDRIDTLKIDEPHPPCP